MSRLEENTLAFWTLNMVYNGRLKGRLTVEGALKTLNRIEARTGPHRKLVRRVARMKDNIVNHGDCSTYVY